MLSAIQPAGLELVGGVMKWTALIVAAAALWSAGVSWCLPRGEPFSEQAARFLTSVRMSRETLATVPAILQDLETALNAEWPGCQVLAFGSTVTGLALADSDIDATALLADRSVPPQGDISYKAAEILINHPDYSDLHPTYYYLPFTHTPTNIKIDLLINNIEGNRNSEMLHYLLSTDKRFLDLATIIKYWWTKVLKANGFKTIPNYGMNFLAVFYLQQRGLLPSISRLQKNAVPFMYDHWNSGFDSIDFEPSHNESLYRLLGGFFEFFNDFDYKGYIISPFLGGPIRRELFIDLKTVPDEFELYRRNVGRGIHEPIDLADDVIIQDPIQHNMNLAVRLGALVGSSFATEVQRIASIYKHDVEETFLDDVLNMQVV